MLVLGRKVQQSIAIGDAIRVTVLRIRGNEVRLGLEASEELRILREELLGTAEPDPQAEGPIRPGKPGAAARGSGPRRGPGSPGSRRPNRGNS
jgi:carbon storage regulator